MKNGPVFDFVSFLMLLLGIGVVAFVLLYLRIDPGIIIAGVWRIQ